MNLQGEQQGFGLGAAGHCRMARVMRRGRRWTFMLKCVDNRCMYKKNTAPGSMHKEGR